MQALAKSTGISYARLKAIDASGFEPSASELELLARHIGMTVSELRLRTGFLDRDMKRMLAQHADEVANLLGEHAPPMAAQAAGQRVDPAFQTSLGTLYRADCVELMRTLPSDSVDLIFADPPFNLDKLYPSEMDDDLRQEQYLEWCEQWLLESVRLLREGGSLFVYNLPKWNTFLSAFLNRHLTFRHWIAVDIKSSLPIAGRLYPSHYSLLYYVKGDRPATFSPDRLPMEICPSCYADLKDYGGYKDKMNPLGVNLTDVWNDIPPVRHAKYKKRKTANELSVKLLDRILEMASNEGDLVLDPFGGSGTTYAVAEMKRRRWIGMELGPVEGIVERMEDLVEERALLARTRSGYNSLFLEKDAVQRERKGLWTTKTFERESAPEGPDQLAMFQQV